MPLVFFVWMFHCCTMFQNCCRVGHVATFITLKYRISCKVLIGGVSFLFFSSSVREMQKPTRACVYSRVTQLCPKAMGWCCRHHHRTYIQMQDLYLGIMVTVVYLPLHMFFQCPLQTPESHHSHGYKT